ncbi:MAG: hypothetical protein KOO63_16140 [Bacteroidales bacterium]|nr:hypothetical protein [Candidatus Latescibacterota bacterium]
MKDQDMRMLWNILHEQTEVPGSGRISVDRFMGSHSESIQNRIRGMLQKDLIFKMLSGLAFLLNFIVYRDTPNVLYVCMAGVVLLATMAWIQLKILQQFNRISDPGLPTKDSLSGIMVFLKRKAYLCEMTLASSGALIFVPGLLLYFFFTYGYVREMSGFGFMVYTILCLIGTVTSYMRVKSQIRFHIRHITACLSDLNEDSLEFAVRTIEKQRKQDETVKLVVGLLLVFGFVLLIGVLKSIVS